jgi:hypothetical protein
MERTTTTSQPWQALVVRPREEAGRTPQMLSSDEPDGYWTRTTSPDGAHVWLVNAWDVRM